MGKYKQWLEYREVEQKLRTQFSTLEAELVSLQACAQQLEAEAFAVPVTSNPIIQALLQQYPDSIPPASTQTISDPIPQTVDETLSSALRNWGSLPDITLPQPYPETPLPQPGFAAPLPENSQPPAEQMTSQPTLPWWLRNVLPTEGGPVDQQSQRTNKLVERWVARWGRQASPQPPDDEETNYE